LPTWSWSAARHAFPTRRATSPGRSSPVSASRRWKTFLDDNERLTPPAEYEARLRRTLPEWQTHHTSDDYVDYTWHAPTVRLLTMRPRLRPPGADYEYPAWAHNALGGQPAAINPGIFLGAKTIAATLLDLLTEPALLQQAQDEFCERNGGGSAAPNGWRHYCPRTLRRPSTCAGPNTSRPHAARDGGSRPRPQARGPATRSDERKGVASETELVINWPRISNSDAWSAGRDGRVPD
jgi:hypothetical protein